MMNNNSTLKEIGDWLLHIIIAVAIAFIIIKFVAQITYVSGSSMLPTLQNGNMLIVEKFTPRFGILEKDDIVILDVPEYLEGNKEYIIKRVIAVENDIVNIKDGKVYVNDTQIQEDYINGNHTDVVKEEFNNYRVPKGEIFVLGDNRLPGASKDSRVIGSVNIKKVGGRAFFRIFPIKEMGVIK